MKCPPSWGCLDEKTPFPSAKALLTLHIHAGLFLFLFFKLKGMYPWLVWCSLFWQVMELLWTPCLSRALLQALTDSERLSSRLEPVVVWSWVGKEFPDVRQKEREIKFIRVGDTVRTVGQLKGELMLSRGPSVQFSRSVVSDSLQPHGLQHTRPIYPSPTPRVYSNLCPSSQWHHPTTSSCRPLLLPPSIFPRIRVFSNGSSLCIRWPKYWSFSFSISPSNEHSGLISFRMDWLDLLAVQGTLKSLLQHHSSKHPFFGAQLSL